MVVIAVVIVGVIEGKQENEERRGFEGASIDRSEFRTVSFFPVSYPYKPTPNPAIHSTSFLGPILLANRFAFSVITRFVRRGGRRSQCLVTNLFLVALLHYYS